MANMSETGLLWLLAYDKNLHDKNNFREDYRPTSLSHYFIPPLSKLPVASTH